VTAAGGTPTEAQIEWGLCTSCWTWVEGPWLRDLTAYTSEVRHCQPGPGEHTKQPPDAPLAG
jgi:hypothetical protein